MSAQKLKPSGVLSGLAGFLGFSVLAGVLVTAMVTPALAVTSVAASSTIGVFENLPDFIRIGEQAQQNAIYANQAGKPVQIATIYKQNRQEVSWKNVSPFLRNAAVAGEDRRFFDHGGVDISSVLRAVVQNATSGDAQGGSTLDMQLVRNILMQEALAKPTLKEQKAAYKDAIRKDPDRKLKEMKLAIGLDKKYSKKEILLAYLNIVGFGGNTYGVESAAQLYFSVPAKDVTLAQAASLIAIVQRPSAQNLSDPKYYASNKIRRDQILNAMLGEKYISQKQHDKAIATKIEDEVKPGKATNGCLNATAAPFVCDYVTKLVPTLNALGATKEQREANWDKGGYSVYTSIDLALQAVAQKQLAVQAPASESRFKLGSAVDSVQVGTGRILVMAQNKGYNNTRKGGGPTTTAVNFSTDFPYGGSGGFPAGSTYKVFDLANWLQNGHGLNDLVNGSNRQTYDQRNFTAPCDPAAVSDPTPYKLNNDGGGGGVMTVRNALIHSVNNAFMNMAERQDLCSIRDTAMSMGAHRADGKPLTVNPAAVIGTNEVAPLTMAGAVATIGGGGLHCDPIIVDKVVSPSGKDLGGQPKSCNQALTPDVAAGVADAMQGSTAYGTSARGNPRDGVPIAGKTGTSPDAATLWIMESTTKVGTAVWTGNISGHQDLRRVYNPQTGQNYAAFARFNIISTLMGAFNGIEGYRGGAYPKPSAAMLGGESSTVPSVIGQTPENAKALLESLNFIYADGGPVPSALPAGKVAMTNPAPGTKTPVGATVTVSTSDGSLATTMPDVVGQDRHDAMGMLTDSSVGFSASKISVQWVPTSSTNPGPGPFSDFCKVLSSNPAAGAAASKADPVKLKISTGLPASDPASNQAPTTGCDP